MTHTLTPETAARFAEIALGHVTREYPHKLDHVMDGPEDVQSPARLHPIFHGSFDWHSCVHGYWLLLRVRRLFPDLPVVKRIEALADEMLTPAKVAGELAYLDRAYSGGFERPYGWAWLIALQVEAARHADRDWGEALHPLAEAFAGRFKSYLPRLTYPIRVGTHFNSAFALTLALEWPDQDLRRLIADKARGWFGQDRDCQAWEPGGDEFLSSALSEALLMRRVLGADFAGWFAGFLPRLAQDEPRSLLEPVFVSDRSDGKIAHLDGCNLSRAWCWRQIAPALPGELAAIARDAADRHLTASLPHVAGDYMGEHWLATFAMLALEG
ncbi:DUF2891 family protein [Sphingomonas sp. MAH-20]|uniref:DUF2891 family protein n=1 Tax=Sphingomonas horti TaxID=2682842 RepID=A0A6I4J1Y6_9SPHN|nr:MULTISPECIES: DUF2891 domain-containing protein [Sphingomonas]MBA2919828.1 DUF2891 domain-containing protein [Sphingomonas sp. CGMCC 1.13658]MVO78068.1 DUF2891 family protein [Sphingomonas horti]